MSFILQKMGQQSQRRTKPTLFMKRKSAKKKQNWMSTFSSLPNNTETMNNETKTIKNPYLEKKLACPPICKPPPTSITFKCKRCEKGITYKKAHHPQCKFSQKRKRNEEMVTDEEKKRRKSSFFLPKSLQSPTPSTDAASKAQTNKATTHQSSLLLNKSTTESIKPAKPKSLASLPADLSPAQCVSVTADILKKVVSNKRNC